MVRVMYNCQDTRPSLKVLVITLGVSLGSGCEQDPTPAWKPKHASPGPIAASPQAQGDPKAGYDALTNAAYITCGLPYSVYQQSAPKTPASERLPGRSGHNADLPYRFNTYTTPAGVELVVGNCLTCHAGYFNGQLIVGLGNEAIDFTEDRSAAIESTGIYVQDGPEAVEWRKWADRMQSISPYIITDTLGANPAINLTWVLLAHHDPKTLAWSKTPLIAPPSRTVLPVSTPPWWRMRKKHAMFYGGEGRGDHTRLMFLATSLCTDTNAEAEALIARYGNDVRAYIASLAPPVYPFPIDRALAGQGQQVFDATCARCHGTYGEHGSYPNLLVDLKEVGTDPALSEAGMYAGQERFYEWLAHSVYGKGAEFRPARGYVAPPLDGVWATAPYLHNGSVPTIAGLLESRRRPRYWSRSFDSTDYDQSTLGWRYTESAYGKQGVHDALERKRLYDTSGAGASNQGHVFADHLSSAERTALLEYLKTL
jgi:hypothetical protein